MKRYTLATALLCFATASFAQSGEHSEPPKPEKFYKLQVRVEQSDSGRSMKAQEVSMTVPLGNKPAHIRSGEKIPYVSGSGDTEAHYQDVGLNVDFSDVEETPSGLSIYMKVEVSTAVPGETGKLPLLRQYNWMSNVLVPIGKPTTVYSDGDSSPSFKMDVKVTATPLELR